MRRDNGRACGSRATGWRSSTTGVSRRGVNTRGWSGRRGGWCRWPCWRRRDAMESCPPGGRSTVYPPGRSREAARRSPERLQTAHRLATGRKPLRPEESTGCFEDSLLGDVLLLDEVEEKGSDLLPAEDVG